MTDLVRQAPLSWWEVVRAQISLVFFSRRKGVAIFLAFVLAQVVALAGFGVILGVTITVNDELSEVGMTSVAEFQDELEIDAPRAVVSLGAVFFLLTGFALFWPFGIWSRERPSERGYHWSLPVSQKTHDLARVVAGAVLLLSIIVAVYIVSMILSIVSGTPSGLGSMSPTFWGGLILGPLVAYMFASIFLVRFEHPAGWFWGVVGGVSLISTATQLAGLDPINRMMKRMAVGSFGFFHAIAGSVWSGFSEGAEGWGGSGGWGWWAAWCLWMVVLASGVVLAASTRRTSR